MRLGSVVAVVAVLVLAPAASASDRDLREYAKGTWASLVAMTDESSGLPADFLLATDGSRSVQTSTTNVGAYL